MQVLPARTYGSESDPEVGVNGRDHTPSIVFVELRIRNFEHPQFRRLAAVVNARDHRPATDGEAGCCWSGALRGSTPSPTTSSSQTRSSGHQISATSLSGGSRLPKSSRSLLSDGVAAIGPQYGATATAEGTSGFEALVREARSRTHSGASARNSSADIFSAGEISLMMGSNLK